MRATTIFSAAALALVAIHCGSSSSSPDPAASSPEAGADAPVGGGVVTPSTGGTVKSADGRVTIEVPPGAVSNDTQITIAPATSYPIDGQVVPGTVYDFGPDGIAFAVPVTMTIAYDPAQVPAGLVEADLRIHKAAASSWSEVAGGTVDTATRVVRAQVSSFSTYGIRSVAAPSIADAGADAPADQEAGPVEAPLGELVVASGFTNVGGVRVEGSHLYWSGFTAATGAGIRRMPIAGGAIEQVVPVHYKAIFSAAFVGSTIFFGDSDSDLFSVPTGGGTPVLHATGFSDDGDLVSDGTSLYWAGADNETDASIARLSVTSPACVPRTVPDTACDDNPQCPTNEDRWSCTDQGTDAVLVCCTVPETFALRRSASSPLSRARHLVLDGGYAYWTENSTAKAWVLRKALGGGDVEEIASETVQNNGANTYKTLVVAGGRVYWARSVDGGLYSAPVTGGDPQKEVSADVGQVRADATHVYFTGVQAQRAGVFRIPIGGGAVEHVARTTSTLPSAGDLALTATHVYYTNLADSSVRRVPK